MVTYNRMLPRLSLPLHTLAFVRDGSAIPTNNKGAVAWVAVVIVV